MLLVLLLFMPISIAAVVMLVSKGKVTWYEFLGLVAILVLVVGLGLWSSAKSATSDTELLNGTVIDKTKLQVSCSHSYPCNCRPEIYYTTEEISYPDTTSQTPHLLRVGSRGGSSSRSSSSRSYGGSSSRSGYGGSRNRSGSSPQRPRSTIRVPHTRTKCDTCYRHPWDFAYTLSTSLGGRFHISPPDEQGLQAPERWTTAYVGEPASSEHTYDNYIKVSPDSVLRHISGEDRFKGFMPKYPTVTDLYRVTHFVPDAGSKIPADVAAWYNKTLGNINGELGPKKQVNILMLPVSTPDPAFQYTLETNWVGGKKNDLIVLLGVTNYPRIDWVRITSWTPAQDLKVELRDRLLSIGSLERKEEIAGAIHDLTAAKYQRMHMKKYEYLMLAYQPSTGMVAFLFMLSCGLTGGLLWWSWTNEYTIETTGTAKVGDRPVHYTIGKPTPPNELFTCSWCQKTMTAAEYIKHKRITGRKTECQFK